MRGKRHEARDTRQEKRGKRSEGVYVVYSRGRQREGEGGRGKRRHQCGAARCKRMVD
jgi:hypothetical protein